MLETVVIELSSFDIVVGMLPGPESIIPALRKFRRTSRTSENHRKENRAKCLTIQPFTNKLCNLAGVLVQP
jgi:hypothetical protein